MEVARPDGNYSRKTVGGPYSICYSRNVHTGFVASVFTNLDAPEKITELREVAPLPLVSWIAKQLTISVIYAMLIQPRGRFGHWSAFFGPRQSAHPKHFRAQWLACGEPFLGTPDSLGTHLCGQCSGKMPVQTILGNAKRIRQIEKERRIISDYAGAIAKRCGGLPGDRTPRFDKPWGSIVLPTECAIPTDASHY